MATGASSVWGIEIGDNSLKALRLTDERGILEVVGFANIRHGKIISGPGINATEREELIALSLRQFLSENDVKNSEVIISVPSQNSFARFVSLPPIEKKRIPEIVRFEAAQQIPFDINEVQWDWQLMTEDNAPEPKVGLFAIKSEVVKSILSYFTSEKVSVQYVQMVPMALYNFALYDRADFFVNDREATVIIDIGAENTDLVICTKSMVWQRSIPMGGNAFTRAIADSFKLTFEKAEKLKRTAPMSKYARQIFQAMRPVFSDLASEIQRSQGFYTSSNPNVKLSRVLAFGGGAKMRGLLKYLGQTLQLQIETPDAFKKLAIGASLSEAQFHDNVSDFGTVYGLALQGLGLAKIESNLLPKNIAHSMTWSKKSKHFIGASVVLLVVAFLSMGRTFYDRAVYDSGQNEKNRREVKAIISEIEIAKENLNSQKNRSVETEGAIVKARELFKNRDLIIKLEQTLLSVLPNAENNPSQRQLYEAFFRKDVDTIFSIPRKKRKQIFITGMSISYSKYITAAQFGVIDDFSNSGMGSRASVPERFLDDTGTGVRSAGGSAAPITTGVEAVPGFVVTMEGYSPYENINELLDPVGVGDDRNKWGVVTRLMNIDSYFGGPSPFELLKEASQFRLEKGAVSLESTELMPFGIGVQETKKVKAAEVNILVDPMTKEEIGKTPELDEYGSQKKDRFGNVIYIENDHWFRLNIKLKWKDAPS